MSIHNGLPVQAGAHKGVRQGHRVSHVLRNVLRRHDSALHLAQHGLRRGFVVGLRGGPANGADLVRHVVDAGRDSLRGVHDEALGEHVRHNALHDVARHAVQQLRTQGVPAAAVGHLHVSLFADQEGRQLRVLVSLTRHHGVLPLR